MTDQDCNLNAFTVLHYSVFPIKLKVFFVNSFSVIYLSETNSMAFHWKMWKSFSWKKIVFSTNIEFVWTLFCVRRCPFRETMDEAAIKPSTDFKGNKLKFDLTTTFLSTRRNSWPSVAYETTLRHTTSGIFEPFDDDEDDYAANVDNVEFVPSKSPCCNGRTFDFNVRTNDFRTNVVRPFWSSPTRQSFRQNAIDVCEDSGQGRCYKNSFCRN